MGYGLARKLSVIGLAEPTRWLPDGGIAVNPELSDDQAKFEQAIQNTPASKEAKEAARKRWPAYHEAWLTQATDTLKASKNLPGIQDYNEWLTSNTLAGHFSEKLPGGKVRQYTDNEKTQLYIDAMKARPGWRKVADNVSTSLVAGGGQVVSGLLGVGAGIGNSIQGVTGVNVGGKAISEVAAGMAKQNRGLTQSHELTGTIEGAGDRILSGIAQAVPSIGVAVATGGTAGLVLGAAQGAGNTYTDLVEHHMAQGDSLAEAHQKAAGTAIVSGGVSLALSKIMPGGVNALNNPATREVVKKGFGATIKSALKGSAEGVTQEAIDGGFNHIASEMNKGKSFHEAAASYAEQFPESMVTAALLGGGVQAAADRRNGGGKPTVATMDEVHVANQTIKKIEAQGSPLSLDQQQQLDVAKKTVARKTEANILARQKAQNGQLHPTAVKDLAKAQEVIAKPTPRDRGPLPSVEDARRSIQGLSEKAANGTLTADEAHQHAHAQRAIAQQRVNDLAPAEAAGTLTEPQKRELGQFRSVLAASPYGTELPKGPPPGYDPRPHGPIPNNPDPRHHEWYPPEGKKPGHPAADKFTPEALALSDSDVRANIERMKNQGHVHDRHGPEVTEGQLDDRVKHQVDPMTQTQENGDPRGRDHRSAEHATQFTSERAMAHALNEIERHPDFNREETAALTHLPRPQPTFVVKRPLKDVLGDKYATHVRGRSLVDPDDPSTGTQATDLTDGNVKAVYKYDKVTRKYYLLTMYPDPK